MSAPAAVVPTEQFTGDLLEACIAAFERALERGGARVSTADTLVLFRQLLDERQLYRAAAAHELALVINAAFDVAADYRDHGYVSPLSVGAVRDALETARLRAWCRP